MLAEFAIYKVDNFSNPASINNIIRVVTKFQICEGDEMMDSNNEWVIRNGRVLVGRFYPFSLHNELLVSELDDAAILDVGTPGRINSLH